MQKTVNIHETDGGSVTVGLPKSMVAELMGIREEHGADSAVGHRISNILAMADNYWESIDPDQRSMLLVSMKRQIIELEKLLLG